MVVILITPAVWNKKASLQLFATGNKRADCRFVLKVWLRYAINSRS
jgi:hypothetical protein